MRRPAFTLVEALVAVTIVGMAGSAIMMGVAAALQGADDAVERAIGTGLAEQLMDEIAALAFEDETTATLGVSIGPDSGESSGVSRENYDDLDDYDGLSNRPPLDVWGIPLGTDDGQGGTRLAAVQIPGVALSQWRRTVEVHFVSASDLTTDLGPGATSDYKAVTVRVFLEEPGRGSREIAAIRRVFGHVPSP
jgi:MSHA pilin protein MshD